MTMLMDVDGCCQEYLCVFWLGSGEGREGGGGAFVWTAARATPRGRAYYMTERGGSTKWWWWLSHIRIAVLALLHKRENTIGSAIKLDPKSWVGFATGGAVVGLRVRDGR